ncbi:MAG: four helix bundle protein [Anaerolineaceae bacterium]|nr:four helix bundle protein [Anaerolineaceae bacterium]
MNNSPQENQSINEHKTISKNNKFSYKNLVVWQKSIEFASNVIDLAENLATTRKHYRLIEQIEAAATSVSMNIAEGKGRFSKKEFSHFLMIARGSLYETLTLLEIFKFRSWITVEDYNNLENQANEIAIKINALYKTLA